MLRLTSIAVYNFYIMSESTQLQTETWQAPHRWWWCLYDSSLGRTGRGRTWDVILKVCRWKIVAHWPGVGARLRQVQLEKRVRQTDLIYSSFLLRFQPPSSVPPIRLLAFVTPATVTPVEEIICASRRVITEAECEIAVTKLCLLPPERPETSTLLQPYYFRPPLLFAHFLYLFLSSQWFSSTTLNWPCNLKYFVLLLISMLFPKMIDQVPHLNNISMYEPKYWYQWSIQRHCWDVSGKCV